MSKFQLGNKNIQKDAKQLSVLLRRRAVGGSSASGSFGTPAIVLGTSAAEGSATTYIRSDATVEAFDATNPTTIAVGDSAATGSEAVAARRDHAHGITTSNNPGAAASILATDAAGAVTLQGLTLATDKKINFRDAGLYLQSSADGQLDIVADTEVQVAATTIDLQGNVDVSTGLDVTGSITVTGTVDSVDVAGANAAQFVTMAASGNHANERVLTAGDGLDLTDAGAGSTVTLAVDVTDFIDTSYGLTEDTNNIRVAITASEGLDFNAGTGALELDVTDILGSGLTESSNNIDLDWGTPTIGTIEPDDSANAGTSTNPARSDHQHAIVCAAPSSNLTYATTNAEGSSTSFARADHSHAITNSSNPGAAASLLATDASGYLQLVGLGIGAAAGAANRITMADGATIGQAAGPLVAFDDTNNYLEVTGCNVGIGTTGPDSLLHVQGNMQLGDGNDLNGDTTLTIYAGMRDDVAGTAYIKLYAAAAVGTQWPRAGIKVEPVDQGDGKMTFYTSLNNVDTDWVTILNTGRVGIGIAAPLAKTHIDQSSTTAAIPVLTLDQGDVSEQAIKVSYSGADVDMRLMTLDVTGTPEFGWDESEDSFTFNKAIHGQGFIGSGSGFVVNDALLHLPFNGGTPYETNFQVKTVGHLGQVPGITGGVIGRPGKFGKGAEITQGYTNLVINSSFEVGDPPTGWTTAGTNTIARSTDYALYGTYSCKCTYQDSNYLVYQVITLTDTEHCASAWIWVPADWDGGNIYLLWSDLVGDTPTAVDLWTAGTDATGEWYRLVSTTVPDSGDLSGRVRIITTSAPTAGRYIYADAVQVTATGYTLPYWDDSLTDSAFAHDAASTRTAAELNYDDYVTDVIRPQGGVSGWLTVDTLPSDAAASFTVDARGADDNNRISVQWSTDDKFDLYLNGAQRITNIGSGSPSQGDNIFWCATWDFTNGNYALYVMEGSTWYSGTDTTSLSAPTLTALSIGSEYDGTNQANGVLDDVCFYDHMPTEDEARQIGESNAPLVVGNGNHSLLLGGDVQSRVVGNDQGLFHYDDAGNERLAVVADDVTWGGESLTSGDVAIGDPAVASILADQSDGIIKVRQTSTTAAIPALLVSQLDVSEEIFEFTSTVGVGNAIEAVGAKTLTTTHFIKCTITGVGTVYFPVGTIA